MEDGSEENQQKEGRSMTTLYVAPGSAPTTRDTTLHDIQ